MRPRVVAEIGNVHLGSLDRAKELAKLAFLCGADYAKFQKRNPIESVAPELQNQPHPNPHYAYGSTYLEHRQNLELNIEQHVELKKFCEETGIKYAVSVWDVTSAKEVIEKLNPEYIKVPSPCNLNYKLYHTLFYEYSGDVHISTGMTTHEERLKIRDVIYSHNMHHRVVIYHCTSEYPCPFEHLYLNELITLKNHIFKDNPVRLGYSGHNFGISVDVATAMLGVDWIERHFIDDRTVRHQDAAASLEADGLRKLVRDLKNLEKALQYKDGLTDEEIVQRKKLRVNHA